MSILRFEIHPFLSFGFPMGVEWLCILVFFAAIAAIGVMVVVLVSRSRPPTDPQRGFPVAPASFPPGPAQFKVYGVDRQTKMDRVWPCTADSPENARVKAELEGIIVTQVERL